jgi:hypothetical protein
MNKDSSYPIKGLVLHNDLDFDNKMKKKIYIYQKRIKSRFDTPGIHRPSSSRFRCEKKPDTSPIVMQSWQVNTNSKMMTSCFPRLKTSQTSMFEIISNVKTS